VHRRSGNRTWRITVPLHLCLRNRGCENACYHATKENEFSPVHSVIGFLKIETAGIGKLRRWKRLKVAIALPSVSGKPARLAMIIICCLPCLPVEIFWHLLTSLQRYICAYVTTRDRPPQLAVVLGQEASDWLRWCTMLSSVCMSRAGLDGKWPDTQFHLTRIGQIGNLRDRRDSRQGE